MTKVRVRATFPTITVTAQRDRPQIASVSVSFQNLTYDEPTGAVGSQRPLPKFISAVRSPSPEVEDRRTFWPRRGQVYRPVMSSRRWRVPTVLLQPRRASLGAVSPNVRARPPSRTAAPLRGGNWSRLSFKSPRSVYVCIRRRNRREVLFAFGRARASRFPRRNYLSSVSCR